MRVIEEEGKTIDEAVDKALRKLNASKENVKIEVIKESENKGLFGLGTSRLVKVKVSLNEDLNVICTKILAKILELMSIKAEIIPTQTKEVVNLEIKTEDTGILIGKRGQTLNALQDIVNLMVSKSGVELRKRIVLDTEDYRRRRNEVLINLAKKSAQDVIAKKQEIELEPMIPQERYIIHSTLQNHPKVITQSRGDGIERRVVILPK
jgi:spoIIIJ-associated protein